MEMNLKILIIFLTGMGMIGCDDGADHSSGFLQVKGQQIVDSHGRQIILNGINYISKNPEDDYMRKDGPELFRTFRDEGINTLRLGIIWDGLEPEPGQYNEAYLREIDKRIQWAEENDLYVFLDMHQDLFSVKYSDGAPEWATLDEGKPHVKGDVWSDAYLISPAVQTAFDNFWANKPAADGIGIQDRFARLWQHIAERYADNTTVIGYDILNEPFMGSDAQKVMPIMLMGYAQVFAETTGTPPPNGEELAAMWSQVDSRLEALKFLEDRDRFAAVVDGLYELNARFDREKLQPMYQNVADAIRTVDTNHILFLEHSYFSNMGVPSAIEPVRRNDGSQDPQVVYAAHGYDLVVDTEEVANPAYERVEFIFDRIRKTGQRMNVPVIIGEWGAYYGTSDELTETAQHVMDIFENFKFGHTYWTYYDNIDEEPYYREVLVRPYPAAVAGELLDYGKRPDDGGFFCEWNESRKGHAPTVVFLPDISKFSVEEVKDSRSGNKKISIQKLGEQSGLLIIPPSGEQGKRRIHW